MTSQTMPVTVVYTTVFRIKNCIVVNYMFYCENILGVSRVQRRQVRVIIVEKPREVS